MPGRTSRCLRAPQLVLMTILALTPLGASGAEKAHDEAPSPPARSLESGNRSGQTVSGNTGAPGSGSIGAHVGDLSCAPTLRTSTTAKRATDPAAPGFLVRGERLQPAEQATARRSTTSRSSGRNPTRSSRSRAPAAAVLGGSRAGKLCSTPTIAAWAGAAAGRPWPPGPSCAAISWGTNSLFNGSGVVALNLVDFNAETTQGLTARATASPPAAAGQLQGEQRLRQRRAEGSRGLRASSSRRAPSLPPRADRVGLAELRRASPLSAQRRERRSVVPAVQRGGAAERDRHVLRQGRRRRRRQRRRNDRQSAKQRTGQVSGLL